MIGFVGLSHLGLNYSLATAAKGFDVMAYDPDGTLTTRCAAGEFPIEEPGFSELLAQHRARIRYTSDETALADCELIFYSLDVATNERNESDPGPLTELIRASAPKLSPGTIAVVLSQVSPGYTRQLRTELRELSPADFYYQVETLIFGRAVERAMQPERFIVGAHDPARSLPAPLQAWHASFNCPVLVMGLESAELAKIAINFFLVSTVATTNTLAEICEAIGADWNEIVPALRLDRRIGPHAYLKPGLGIAGGNLERDLITVQSLAARHGTEAGIVTAWQRNSRHRRDWAIRQIERAFPSKEHQAVLAVWGFAYKADTQSTKNSPSLELMRALYRHRIRAHDPVAQIDAAEFPHVTTFSSPLAAAEGADALLVMTPWSSYASLPVKELQKVLRGRIIIDPYAILDEAQCRDLGFEYQRLGNQTIPKIDRKKQMKAQPSNSRSIQGRNVLIIGKNSYVGEFLCQHFSAQGAAVVAVGSSDCNFLDSSSVHKLFKSLGGNPFAIIFLAVVNKNVDNSYSAFLNNVQMAWNLVSGARDANVESVVYFSSVDVYGRAPKLPMSETTSLDPDTWYGLSKSTSEWIVREELGSKFPTCLLRIPGIFGRSRNDRSVIGQLIATIRKEGKAYIYGDGKLLRDYVFAPDLCQVVERLLTRKASGTFNVATGTSVSLLQILEAIRNALGIDFEVVHLPANAERSFDMRYDISRLSAAIGNFDFSPLSAGIRSYL